MNVIQKCYNSVYDFNNIAGNFNGVDVVSLGHQLDFIYEELRESWLPIYNGLALKENQIEILDGACDMFVTVAGLMQKLSAMGYSVEEALTRVCENNMSKFPTVVKQDDLQKGWDVTYNTEHNVCVLKDENGKIRKPQNFVSVDLSDCVPLC